jgi:hypothetical protein
MSTMQTVPVRATYCVLTTMQIIMSVKESREARWLSAA